ncbi:MAG: hypothetical protein Q9190_004553 [Brigantiaea leucoxantha]
MIDYEDMDSLDPSAPLPFNLFHNPDHEASLQAGSVKTTYEVKKDGPAIFDKKKSGHTMTVERLLWVDGWKKTTMEGDKLEHDQEMTLVVLKVVLASHDPNSRFGYATITLSFEDSNGKETQGANEPQVEAWAPFHTQQRWNPRLAHYKKTDKADGNVKIGYSGSDASVGRSSQLEISWDRAAFDQGRSNARISDITRRRNGVTWNLEQNQLEKAGVSQELWVAVLLSRWTTEPYLVKFEIDARIGTIEDFRNKTKNFFGCPPDRTKPFLVTPRKNPVCNFEGRDIMKSIDLDNLGKLQERPDSTKLDMKWGPNYQIEIPTPFQQASEISSEDKMAGESIETERKSEKLPESGSPASTSQSASLANPALLAGTASIAAAAAAPPITAPPAASGLLQAPHSSLPPLMIGWYNPSGDSERLKALEARTVQIETRIAAQDSLILQLQQALLTKNL